MIQTSKRIQRLPEEQQSILFKLTEIKDLVFIKETLKDRKTERGWTTDGLLILRDRDNSELKISTDYVSVGFIEWVTDEGLATVTAKYKENTLRGRICADLDSNEPYTVRFLTISGQESKISKLRQQLLRTRGYANLN